jgi:ketosteroid isomerase-like protein
VIDDESFLRVWDAPDLVAIRELSADDLEVVAVAAAIEPRHYTGPDAAVQWLTELRRRLKADWSATKLTRLTDDALVIEGELRFRDPGATGAERQPFAVLMRLREGTVCWIGTFMTFAAAKEAWELGVGG